MSDFVKPAFGKRKVELRYVDGEIGIYGTREGLKRLADLIQALAVNPRVDHTHLEDYELLTEESLIGIVVVFNE